LFWNLLNTVALRNTTQSVISSSSLLNQQLQHPQANTKYVNKRSIATVQQQQQQLLLNVNLDNKCRD
jgi:hypothetical protein